MTIDDIILEINRPPNDFGWPAELFDDAVTAMTAELVEQGLCPYCGQSIIAPADLHLCPTQMFRSIRRR